VAKRDPIDEAFAKTWRELGLSGTLPPDSFADTIDEKTRSALFGHAPSTDTAEGFTDPTPTLPQLMVAEVGSGTPSPSGVPTHDLEIRTLLGEGGMGRVLLARQHSLDREVAVKLLKPTASPVDAQALCREAVVTGQLEHPNIVPVHALGHDDDQRPLMVMKRVEGTSWWEMLHDPDHASWQSIGADPGRRLLWHLETLMQLCNAVAFAHSRGVIHRDIKPENVMIGDFGQVYLVDWGLAGSPAATDMPLLGTPAYMAPEMLGGTVDQRTDVYLLGATLHEVLTGEPRHHGQTLQELARAIYRSDPVDYDVTVPAELASLANRATSRDPVHRPTSVLEFRRTIADHLEHRGSNELCVSARVQLKQAVRMLDERPAEPSTVRRPLDVARFGYVQALERWPENPAARHGLRRCDLARVRLELALRNPDAARAALGDLRDPPPELVAQVDALERELSEVEAEQAKLRKMATEMDRWVASRLQRLVALLWCLPVVGGMIYLMLRAQDARAHSHGELLAFGAGELGLFLLAMIIARRRLLRNAFNRRTAGWFLLLVGSLVLSRVVGLLSQVDQKDMVVAEMVLLGSVMGAGGIFVFRSFWLGALFFWGAAFIASLVPGTEIIARMVGGSLAIIVCVILWRPTTSVEHANGPATDDALHDRGADPPSSSRN